MSAKFSAAAATWTRVSPSPGSGGGTSATSSTSGNGPYRGTRQARIRRSPSAPQQDALEHPGPELQRVHRHALVDAVEERGEVEVRGQAQRGEAEAAHPELDERL